MRNEEDKQYETILDGTLRFCMVGLCIITVLKILLIVIS
jgi:hypothetical protein